MLRSLKNGLLILLITLSCSLANAQEKARQSEPVKSGVIDQIRELTDNIAKRKAEIRRLDNLLSAATVEIEVNRLTAERAAQQDKLKEQLNSVEQLATGAVDKSLFDTHLQEEFSWESELKDIFKPLLFEIKQFTIQPRQIERLRGEKSSLQARLNAADLAIKEIETLSAVVESKKIKNTLNALLTQWHERREDLSAELQLVEFQLKGKLDGGESRVMGIFRALKDFLMGRGLHIFLATLGFVITFIVLRLLSNQIERYLSRGRDKERRVAARVLHIIFQILALVLSIIVLMSILYMLGDWLLLALLFVVLIAVLFALRHSLPRFINEVRILLNLGAVREGERVVYNGLPWRISRLNIYSTLVNPLLTGGRIKLPLSEMVQLISRRWMREEPWFPCKPNEYVILDDNSYGFIVMQTPEIVRLQVQGGAVKTYTVQNFLDNNPRNLSEGFGVYVTFGLDYGLQAVITTTVLSELESSLREAFSNSEFGNNLINLRVEFKAANSSALEILLITTFSGDAAKSYFAIERFLQKAVVDNCNKLGWTIPFNQLTVHMQQGESQ